MNLAEQAAAIFRQCTHYNMLTGEGFCNSEPADLVAGLCEVSYTRFQGPRAFLIMRKLDASHRVIRQRVGYDDGSSLLYTWDHATGPQITTNDRKPEL